jgi:hypothetical protein
MKIKASQTAFFWFHLFFGIGAFQRVTGKKMENFPPALASECSQGLEAFIPPPLLSVAASASLRSLRII